MKCDPRGHTHAHHRHSRLDMNALALNASHFNTQRMVQEYVLKAYFG